MTDLERALADIAEVRERLGHVQRFKGYSAFAAALSGGFAVVAGVLQRVLVPQVGTVHQGHLYFALWFSCCAAALLVNYGTIAHWYVNDASARDRWQTATVGLAIIPALLLGGTLSFAMLHSNLYAFLPGTWLGCYGVGLFASRTMVPRAVTPIAAGFLLGGAALLFVPASIALSWWILPLGFGCGQLAIGASILRDRMLRP
jgi:hypothetical protein